jgi:hypothetical protein
MQQHRGEAVTPSRQPIPGATATVVRSGGGVPRLFSGNGTGLLGSNVLTADANGEFAFYAANGSYTITVVAAGYADRVYEVALFDSDDLVLSITTFGAVANGASGTPTDNTAFIQAAIDECFAAGGGAVYVPAGVYRCRNVELKARVYLFGAGPLASKLRFMPSGSEAADADSYVVNWTGSYSGISGLEINGQASALAPGLTAHVSNGLRIAPDADGWHRTLKDVRVVWFAGYSASPEGGPYGTNENFSAADIRSGSTHLLNGGNAILLTTGSGNEMRFGDVFAGYCDGDGIALGTANDGKMSNVYVANAMNRGIVVNRNNKNWQWNNVKVYLCRRLNVREIPDIVPYTLTSSDNSGAVVLTGAGHQFTNVEAQENGSHGFQLGTGTYSLSNSRLQLFADGNGGYVAGSGDNVAYRRYGVYGYNFARLDVTVLASDFRARLERARQSRAMHILGTRPQFTAIGGVVVDNWYRIGSVAGGADFTPLQAGYASPANTVGAVFQCNDSSGTPDGATVFGSGYLEAVNGHSRWVIWHANQAEALDGTGTGGPDINSDDGNSSFSINGTTTVTGAAATSVTFAARVGAENANRFELRANGDLRWGDGSNPVDVSLVRLSPTLLGTGSEFSLRAGGGAWNTGHLQLGNYHVWFDATGVMRRKDGAPSSDTDGDVVGAQS